MPTTFLAIAEDSKIMREGLIGLLSDFGFSFCIEANSGVVLLEQLTRASVLPALCIIDINMPNLNGYDTLVAIKKRWPEMKVLICSMFNSRRNVLQAAQLGANGFVSKDVDAAFIADTIKRILEYGSCFPSLDHISTNKRDLGTNQLQELTPRELDFLKHACSDKSYKEIRVEMNISVRTIDSYCASLYKKLKVNNRSGLVLEAMRMGIIPMSED